MFRIFGSDLSIKNWQAYLIFLKIKYKTKKKLPDLL